MLSVLGDVTAQRLELSFQGMDTSRLDSRRALGMGSFAGTLSVFFWLRWYSLLDIMCGQGSLHAAAVKTAANNLFAIPFVELPAYYAWTSLLSGHGVEAGVRRMRETYGDAIRGSAMVWIPGNFLIFKAVPPHLRVPTCDLLEYASAMIMSLASNRLQQSDERTLDLELD